MEATGLVMSGLKVFTFWNGPIEAAPAIVRAATESWRKGCHLDGYDYHIINEENLESWEDLMGDDGDKLKYFRKHGRYVPDHKWRKYSDMLRLLLLKHFNGIWVDATVLLMTPLRDWIPDPTKFGGLQLPKGSGFMEIESWLLISLRPCTFVEEWADQFADYSVRVNEDAAQWKVKRFSIPWWMHRYSSKIRGWSNHWFDDWFIRLYPRSPYYAIYYSFSLMWSRVSRIHGMQRFKVFLPYSLDAWSNFNSRQRPDWHKEDMDVALLDSLSLLPFLKLDWKRSPKKEMQDLPDNSVIKHLWLHSLVNKSMN